jgi:hypothetical protein
MPTGAQRTAPARPRRPHRGRAQYAEFSEWLRFPRPSRVIAGFRRLRGPELRWSPPFWPRGHVLKDRLGEQGVRAGAVRIGQRDAALLTSLLQ